MKPADLFWGSILAYKLGTGITLCESREKLPYKTHQVTYDLEYGSDVLEIHEDASAKGDRVIIADDLLATGGTMAAVINFNRTGADLVECAFLAELEFLNGRSKLPEDKGFQSVDVLIAASPGCPN